MVDEVDRSIMDAEILDAAQINLIRRRAAAIPVGEPGECKQCGEDFSRLVRGHCGRCRDKLGLP